MASKVDRRALQQLPFIGLLIGIGGTSRALAIVMAQLDLRRVKGYGSCLLHHSLNLTPRQVKGKSSGICRYGVANL